MRKVIELIRVSTNVQAREDRASIPAQRAINRRTAQTYQLEIVHTIQLVNVSGTAVLRTPEMQTLLRLIQNPQIAGVVAREFSRVMRPDCFSDYVLFQAFQESGTVLFLPDGPVDLNTKHGRLLGMIRATIAGMERSEFMERVFAGKEEKRKAGKHPNNDNVLPYGVGYDKVRGWFYKPEATKVKEAFHHFLSGRVNYWAVAKKLGFARESSLRYIMRNPIYCGWRVIDTRCNPLPSASKPGRDGRQGYTPKIMRAPEDVIRVKVIDRPLISEEQFRRVQTIMDAKKHKHWTTDPNHRSRFAFTGFLTCGLCGGRLYSAFTGARKDYYACKNRRLKLGCSARFQPREPLENRINQLLGEQIRKQAFLREIVAGQAANQASKNNSRSAELRLRLANLKQKRQRVLDLYIEGIVGREECNTRMLAIQRSVDRHTELLLREPDAHNHSFRELARFLSPFSRWKSLSPQQKRCVLVSTTAAIHVDRGQILGISMQVDCGSELCSPPRSRSSITPLACRPERRTLYVRLPVPGDQ